MAVTGLVSEGRIFRSDLAAALTRPGSATTGSCLPAGDRRPIEEALPLVRALDPGMTRERLESLAARLPERVVRPRAVGLEEEVEVPAGPAVDPALRYDHYGVEQR